MARSASAPGKLVLAGEYAVLDGAPAVVMAVDRRARVVAASPVRGRREPVPDVLASVCAELGTNPRAVATRLDTQDFYAAGANGERRKLGLGSSAALTAALCRLYLPDKTSSGEVLAAAFAAHRRFQSGLGSGVDVAASVIGGLLQFRMRETAIEPLAWPDGLRYAVFWSGVPASTTERLQRLNRTGHSTARGSLGEAAHAAASAWAGAGAPAVIDAMRDYVESLAAFDAWHRLDIFAAGHLDLVKAARKEGLVYKPCGAGGGDTGVLLGNDAVAVEAFVDIAQARGFRRLALAIDPAGARLDGAAP